MSLSNADNTLRRARNLGNLSGRRRNIPGIVGSRDRVDFYRFAVSEVSDFSLTLGRSRSSDRLTVRLHNSLGQVIRAFRNPRNGRPVTIAQTLGADTHYISVRINSRNNARYRLSAAATLAEPGNTSGTARNIGVLNGIYNNQDLVGGQDDLDYYRFSLNQISDFSANLGGLSQSVDMALALDTNNNGLIDAGEEFVSVRGSSSNNGFISTALPPGSYFLELDYVGFSTENTAYQLNLTQTARPGNLPNDPSNNSSTAYNLGTLSGNVAIADLVGGLDDKDYYRFAIDQIGDFSLNLGSITQSIDVAVALDANNNGLLDGTEQFVSVRATNFQNGFIDTALPPGNYFLELDYVGSSIQNTRYELNLTQTPRPGTLPTDPGNNSSTAYNLGNLAGTLSIGELVGTLDDKDYYRFTIDQPRNFTATLGGVSQSIDISLGLDSNSNGLFDGTERLTSNRASTFSDGFINRILQPGTYFLELDYAGTSIRNTRYQLALTAV